MKVFQLLFVSLVCFGIGSNAQEPKTDPSTKPAPKASPTTPATVYKNVSVEEFDKLRANKEAIVLDVRTEKEFKAGHIAGAINVDVNAKDFEAQVSKLGAGKTYLVHCKAGVRSMRACKMMAPLNLGTLYNLEEGFDAWAKAGKPVEK